MCENRVMLSSLSKYQYSPCTLSIFFNTKNINSFLGYSIAVELRVSSRLALLVTDTLLQFPSQHSDHIETLLSALAIEHGNWASEASPTLGCSIEISRDIYVGMYVCMSVVFQITWNHVNQTRACSKSVLGGKIRPVTPVLFVSTIR